MTLFTTPDDLAELEAVGQLLERQTWTFAKTMPNNPHYWTLRKRWNGTDQSFCDTVAFIRAHGIRVKHGKTYYTVLDYNGHRYWSMGRPIGTREEFETNPQPITTLINRRVL